MFVLDFIAFMHIKNNVVQAVMVVGGEALYRNYCLLCLGTGILSSFDTSIIVI